MSGCLNCQISPEIYEQIIRDCQFKNSLGSCFACAKLQDLEGKILDAHRSLEQLLVERNFLASTLNAQHDTLTHRLPVELVSQVFIHSLPFSPSIYVFNAPFSRYEHMKSVLKLGQICRDWRRIAHRTPELWTIFAATITDRDHATLEKNWLERSGGLPLFMRLRGCEPTNDDIQRAITTIALPVERCLVLDIEIPSTLAPSFSAALSTQSLDRLQHLFVDLEDDPVPNDGEDLELCAAPTALTLRCGYLNHIKINWDCLTQFFSPESQCLMVDECILLFKNAPNLILSSLADVSDPADHIHRINHSSLQTLVVGTCAADFWNHFVFPALKTLSIASVSPHSLTRLEDFLMHSGSAIVDLSIVESYEASYGREAKTRS